jgi:hypothetical protein
MPDGERKTRIAAVGITQESKSGFMVIRGIFSVTDKVILPMSRRIVRRKGCGTDEKSFILIYKPR